MDRYIKKMIPLVLVLLLCTLSIGTVSASPQLGVPGVTELFFSEYIEGSSYNKAVEIYNGTGAAIDLTAGAYAVQVYSNGNTIPSKTVALTGTLADGDVFVIADYQASQPILDEADDISETGYWNGDDAVVLLKGATIIDVIGQIGFDPGSEWGTGDTSTQNNTIRRKVTVLAGDPIGDDAFDPSIEWDGYPEDTFDGLGSHTIPVVDYTPIYDLQYTTDPSGDSPYKDQVGVTTEGVVTAVFYNGYYIEDSAGGPWNGIWVYDDANSPAVGDRLRLTGTVAEYYNLTEFLDVTSFEVESSGNLVPAPVVLSTAAVSDEQWEGVLVKVENVSVTDDDLGYGEWSVSDGSGDVVIDDKGSYTYLPANGDLLAAVIGPVDFGFGAFKILPRDDNDIILPVQTTSIYDIQYTEDSSGDSPLTDQEDITTEGIVTAVFYNGYFIQEPAGGPWSGLFVYDSSTPAIGDYVKLTGTVAEYYGLTQLKSIAQFEVLTAGNLVPAPAVLATGDVSQEQWEGVLVKVEFATVTDDALGYGEWSVDDSTGDVVIDDKGSYTYVPTNGDLISALIGPLDYGYGAFKIQPRDDDDIVFCGDPYTPIFDIQGDGDASPLAGTPVTTMGVVVGDFQETIDNNYLKGFFIQDEVGDGNPLTSDAIFVYAPGGSDVQVGDLVRVDGYAGEYYDMTQVSGINNVDVCSIGISVAPTALSLPFTPEDNMEIYEGMLLTFEQPLYINEYYNFGRYGELVLSSERKFQPTAIYDPKSVEAANLLAENMLDRLILDDGRTSQNPDPAIHPNGEDFDLTNLFRGGDEVTNLTGVLNYSYGEYKLQPTQGADYTNANPRTASPDPVGGNVTVASFNVLNYFTTLDDDDCPYSGGCRGADNAEEFTRQRAKIVAAIAAIDADVVGLIEIENHPGDVPVADLVSGLNDAMGDGTYDYVATGAIGSDAIRQAFIYKPASVTLMGDFAVLDDPSFTDPLGYGEDKSRPALAQTFIDNSTGGVFTAVVNHLKSKGSSCGDGDDDPEAGSCNLTRTLGAQALVDWLATDPTGSGDEDFMIIGDLNAYDKEDPIDALLAGGYTDLVFDFLGEHAYSYVFDGQLGYLDHGLANAPLEDKVSGVTIWHINADEANLIDYDTSYKKDAQDAIYWPDAYRSSDHDPVIVGLELTTEQEIDEMMDYVQTLVDEGILTGGQGNSLFSKLVVVLAKLETGKINAAVNQLNATINQLEGFTNGSSLTTEQAVPLIKSLEAIVFALEN